MKIRYALPLAVAIGLGLGAIATRGLHARTTTPPVYVVVEIDEITDANGFEALRQTADGFFAFIAFDNMTRAKTFIDSMKNTTALRTKVTNSRSFIVEGTMR